MSIKLNEFFNKVSSEKTMLTTAARGIDFEQVLINKLIEVGFNRMLKEESICLDIFLNKIKPTILKKTDCAFFIYKLLKIIQISYLIH